MGWRENVGNFDLGRLTALGWLAFLASAAAGMAAAYVVGTNFETWFPPQQNWKLKSEGPVGVAGIGGALGTFFAIKGLLHLVGLRLMRPMPEQTDNHNEAR